MSVLRNMMIADRIVSLGLLAAGLSHHIKNSMVAVKTFLELAPVKMAEEKISADRLRDPDFWHDYHQNVQGQIEKINGLLADLRTVSENPAEAPFAYEIKVQPVVAAILAGLQPALAARQIVVENEIPETLPAIHVDLPKFKRMFELLFQDELSMLPAGSHVRLSAEEVTGCNRPEVAIRLTDNGPALPPDALRVVLNPFTGSGASSEYGINLMACFFIAHHHGGTIEAHSPAGGGNVFNIRLPVQPEPVITTSEDTQFLKKALLNEQLWDKLITNH
jgi:two-component system probable response regulator PhcQ